jgi:ATP-binding cassette subfamily B protein
VSLNSGKVNLENVIDFLKMSIPKPSGLRDIKIVELQDFFTLEGVSYKYPNSENLILDNIDLKIHKGSKIGVVGKTGSGKSTLIDIITGLLTPTIGSLFVDNNKIIDTKVRSWQLNIAYVPQAIYLSDTTILENIAVGIEKESIDFELVKFSAQQAQISDVIEKMELQYNTIIGERGIRLSGGQRQRIGIARALYKRANVIIFDEATSALDDETELDVMQAINNLSGELTVIIIAHRYTTLKNCDSIYEIKDCKLIPYDSYDLFVKKRILK